MSQVLVIDDAICRVELTPKGIQIFGLERGESVVFAWVGDQRKSLLVRVVLPPPPPVRRAVSQERVQRLGQGEMGTNAQVTIDPAGGHTYHFQHHVSWSQQADGRKLSFRGQAHDTTAPDVPLNVDTVSAEYATPGVSFTFLDFGLSMNGGDEARIASYSPMSAFVFRGVHAAFRRGANQLELFIGTTLPSYYRSLQGTSRIAGVNLNRRHSSKLYVYSTTAAIAVPGSGIGTRGTAPGASVFHTSGFAYHLSDRWATQLTAGVSNRGLYGDAGLSVTGNRFSASGGGATSSPEFPLNQLQLLSGGGSSIRAATTWQPGSRVAASLFYQYTSTRPSRLFSSVAGVSEYINPNVNLPLSRSQALTLNGVYSRGRGGLMPTGQTLVRSVDLGWNSQMMGRLSNSAQVSVGTSEDPEQINSGVRLSFRNSLSLRIKGGYLNLAFQHSRRDPSLVTRLRQQIGLLPAHMQELFLADPVGFVYSSNLPLEVRTLLESLRSEDSQVSLSSQFRIGSVNLSTSYSLMQNLETSARGARTHAFGYTVALPLTSTLQIRSSLSDTYVLSALRDDLVRTATFSLGLSKRFQGAPGWLPSTRTHKIEGHVFVDRNVTGVYDDGEGGLSGIMVQLSDGRTVTTDAAGRFRFTGLKAGVYRLILPIGQFREPVRATSLTSVSVELYDRTQVRVDFGIVNFARVMGSVFNDDGNAGERRVDSVGLQKVTVAVTGADGVDHLAVTDGSGEYRIDDLPPGTYRIRVDPNTIPPNYMGPAGPVIFVVKPTRTAVVDVPMRALRSIVGHVHVSVPASPGQEHERKLVPVPGITVTAGQSQSTTDAAGRFILRDLPAGDVVVAVSPAKPLPPRMRAPAGTVHLPKGPVQIEGGVIVINNPELLNYLK